MFYKRMKPACSERKTIIVRYFFNCIGESSNPPGLTTRLGINSSLQSEASSSRAIPTVGGTVVTDESDHQHCLDGDTQGAHAKAPVHSELGHCWLSQGIHAPRHGISSALEGLIRSHQNGTHR
jgi:hypothetical protein